MFLYNQSSFSGRDYSATSARYRTIIFSALTCRSLICRLMISPLSLLFCSGSYCLKTKPFDLLGEWESRV